MLDLGPQKRRRIGAFSLSKVPQCAQRSSLGHQSRQAFGACQVWIRAFEEKSQRLGFPI